MSDRFLKETHAAEMAGISKATLRRYMKAGQFPKQRRLGPGRVAWLESEVKAWMDSKQAA